MKISTRKGFGICMTPESKIAAGYGSIFLWMFLPMIPVAIASAIAWFCGSQLDEGGPHPCILFGRDIGGMLSDMAMMGWFGLLTLPSGFLALIIFNIIIKRRKLELGL
jgi:hypothetical protein